MLNTIFGLTPQVHINESISLGADLSYIILFSQHRTADFRGNADNGIGGCMNATLGISFGF